MGDSSLERWSSYWRSYKNCEQTLIPYLVLLTQGCFCFPKAAWMWPADDTKYSQLKRLCLKEKMPNCKRPVVVILWQMEQQQIFLPFPLLAHRCQASWHCLAGSPQSCCWEDSSPPCWKAGLDSPCRAKEMFPLAGELQWILNRAFSPNKLPKKRGKY